jgi:hypothetical protein
MDTLSFRLRAALPSLRTLKTNQQAKRSTEEQTTIEMAKYSKSWAAV